jgi:hypothetical protein
MQHNQQLYPNIYLITSMQYASFITIFIYHVTPTLLTFYSHFILLQYAFTFQIKQAVTAKQAEIHTYAIEGIEGGSGGGYQSTSSTDNVRVSLPSLP